MTVEERAKESLVLHFEESRNTFNKEHSNMREWGYGYCQGATEQKQIDIDKACEWLYNDLANLSESIRRGVVKDFRKAMEKGL